MRKYRYVRTVIFKFLRLFLRSRLSKHRSFSPIPSNVCLFIVVELLRSLNQKVASLHMLGNYECRTARVVDHYSARNLGTAVKEHSCLNSNNNKYDDETKRLN